MEQQACRALDRRVRLPWRPRARTVRYPSQRSPPAGRGARRNAPGLTGTSFRCQSHARQPKSVHWRLPASFLGDFPGPPLGNAINFQRKSRNSYAGFLDDARHLLTFFDSSIPKMRGAAHRQEASTTRREARQGPACALGPLSTWEEGAGSCALAWSGTLLVRHPQRIRAARRPAAVSAVAPPCATRNWTVR